MAYKKKKKEKFKLTIYVYRANIRELHCQIKLLKYPRTVSLKHWLPKRMRRPKNKSAVLESRMCYVQLGIL